MKDPTPAEDVVTPDVPDPYLLEGIQDIEDPSWFPFTTDGATTFDEQRHGTEGILSVHGFKDLLGHLKEPDADELKHWLDGGADVRHAPEWLAAELLPLFRQSTTFEMFLNATQLGGGVATYQTTGAFPYGPRSGRAWVYLAVGCELSAASTFQVFKGPLNPAAGFNRIAGNNQSTSTKYPWLGLAKGQLVQYNGQYMTFQCNGANILSIFASGIDVPASRVAEFVVA